MRSIENVYLGDGLYGSFDGYHFRLWAERASGIHEVFLDESTLEAFLRMIEAVYGRKITMEAK